MTADDGSLSEFSRSRTVRNVSTIPIVEERVEIDKKVSDGRTVTVTTRPRTVRESVSEPVTHEHVTVERKPVDKVVSVVPEVRRDGDLTVIPVIAERPRIVVDIVLVEEIHLRRTRKTTLVEQDVDLQSTEVIIDEQPAD